MPDDKEKEIPAGDSAQTEKRRLLARRLDLPEPEISGEALALQIQNALDGAPSPWETALCRELGIAITGLPRRAVRELLYLKKHTTRAKLNKAMQKVGQEEPFKASFDTMAHSIKKGSDVLTWANKDRRTVTAFHKNGRVQFKNKSSSIHLTGIQCVLGSGEDKPAGDK